MSTPGGIAGNQIVLGITTTHASGSTGDVPVALNDKTDGALITGVTAGKNASGATVLRTDQGEMTLATDLYLRRGSEVMLQLDRSGNQTSARIVTVDGLSLGKYLDTLSQASRPSDSVATSSLGAPSLTPDPVKALASVTATGGTPVSTANPASVEARIVGLPAGIPADVLASLPENIATALMTALPGTALSLTVVQLTLPDAATPALQPLPLAGTGESTAAPAILPQAPAVAVIAPALMAGFAAYGKLVQTAPASTPLPATHSGIPNASPAPTAGGLPSTSAVPAEAPQSANPVLPVPAGAEGLLPNAPPSAPVPQSPLPLPASASPGESVSAKAPVNAVMAPSFIPAATAAVSDTAPPASGTKTMIGSLQTQTAGPPATLPTSSAALPLPALQATPSGLITATVIGSSAPGELILQTPLGTMKLMDTQPLPIGSRLGLRLDAVGSGVLTQQALPLASLVSAAPVSGLNGLEEVAGIPVPPTAFAAANLFPRPGKELISDVLLFFSVMKGETDTRKWLGDKRIEMLETASKGSAIGRVENEIGSLRAGSFDASSPQGWNQMMVPFQIGGRIEPVQLFWKRRRADPAKLSEGDQEHFLIDLRLSQWGRMQLDGLVKKQAPLGFDLTVRSERPLGKQDERAIGDIYRNAAEGAGFTGSLLFRHGASACVPLPGREAAVPRDHSIVV